MPDYEITTDDLIAEMSYEEVEDWGNFEHDSWEAQVAAVASAIREIHGRRGIEQVFCFDWNADLEGGVTGAAVGYYDRRSSCGVVKFNDLRGLTMNRAATGRDQAEAIYEALMLDYRAVITSSLMSDEVLYAITREDLTKIAGRPLTDDEAARFTETFQNTTVGACIHGWLDGANIHPDAEEV